MGTAKFTIDVHVAAQSDQNLHWPCEIAVAPWLSTVFDQLNVRMQRLI